MKKQLTWLLCLLLMLTAAPVLASDIESSNWSETAASNNATPPNGWPEGMAPSTVNDAARENMGALKRDWNRSHTTISSTGSSNAYVLTYSTAPTAYVNGQRFAFKANFANTATATANVNSLGAKTIKQQGGAGPVNLVGGEIQVGQHVILEYDSVADALILLNPQSITAGLASPINEAKGADIASATTTDIGAATGNYVQVTGTTTITGFGTVQAGTRRIVKFTDVLTLTYNATSLILPTAANITTAVGDTATFISLGSGNWICVSYLRADGSSVGSATGRGAQGIIGTSRNAKMSVTTAGATATFTADEVVVETSLGGTQYKLSSYSQSINLGSTGAGGMDTGSAPVSGFVSLYAIYNPATSTASILAASTATSSGSVYSGANMPSGYTASALIGVWPTNGSSQFIVGFLRDRKIWIGPTNVLNVAAGAAATTYTSFSLSAIVPTNAITVFGRGGSNSSTIAEFDVASDANGTGVQRTGGPSITSGLDSMNGGVNFESPMITAQTLYYKSVAAANPARVDIVGYTF